jgi:hypothetical protein
VAAVSWGGPINHPTRQPVAAKDSEVSRASGASEAWAPRDELSEARDGEKEGET